MSFYDSIALIVNIILVILIIVSILWFIRQNKVKKLNERLSGFAIEKEKENNSFFDVILNFYYKIRNRINSFFYKKKLFTKYAQKYEKYVDKTKPNSNDAMNYVSSKFICMFIAFLLVLLNNVFQDSFFNLLELLLGLIIGFFIPDLFIISKEKIATRRMENDLLKAITIMNNSFKSGKSIIQTIHIVTEELDGPLKKEFLKVERDLNYGLEINVVFDRFSNRVNLDEIKYLSASLSILNKTGGDIIEVFSSIEKNVFNNRKLNEELHNLTASSKFLYRVLISIPPFFALTMLIIDPTYFKPLIGNNLGIIILVIVFLLYISYIFIVKRIIKLKEY